MKVSFRVSVYTVRQMTNPGVNFAERSVKAAVWESDDIPIVGFVPHVLARYLRTRDISLVDEELVLPSAYLLSFVYSTDLLHKRPRFIVCYLCLNLDMVVSL